MRGMMRQEDSRLRDNTTLKELKEFFVRALITAR